MTASRHYRPNWDGYSYRPAYARSLLRQAGCRRGTDGVFVCGGDRLSLRLVTRAGIEFREHTVQLIQRQLLKAGIEVVLSYATSGAFLDQILPGGDFDLAEYAWFRDSTGGDAKDREGCGGVHNYGGYCQRLLTSDLDQATRILDDRRRAQVLNRADRRLAQDVPVLPLYEQPQMTAARNGIRGFAKFDGAPFWHPENWWLER